MGVNLEKKTLEAPRIRTRTRIVPSVGGYSPEYVEFYCLSICC